MSKSALGELQTPELLVLEKQCANINTAPAILGSLSSPTTDEPCPIEIVVPVFSCMLQPCCLGSSMALALKLGRPWSHLFLLYLLRESRRRSLNQTEDFTELPLGPQLCVAWRVEEVGLEGRCSFCPQFTNSHNMSNTCVHMTYCT